MRYEGPIVTRAEAKAKGLARYFTGKPCKNGHIVERITANGTCRVCSNALSEAAHRKSPEKPRAARKRWREANREKHNAWGRNNLAARRAIGLRWSRLNKEKRRAYHETNAEVIRKKTRDWAKKNPDKATVLRRNRRAREAAAEGKHTASEIRVLLKQQREKCAYCRISLKGGYHADHIVALANGGSNWITNIQLTCPDCNMRKNRSDSIDFARRKGLLL